MASPRGRWRPTRSRSPCAKLAASGQHSTARSDAHTSWVLIHAHGRIELSAHALTPLLGIGLCSERLLPTLPFAMPRLRQFYRASRLLSAVAVAAFLLSHGLIQWPAPAAPAPAPRATAPELETDVADATKAQMTPAGTTPPKPLSLP